MKIFTIFAKVVLVLTLIVFYVLTIGGCFVMTTEAAISFGTGFGIPMLIIDITLVTIAYDLCKEQVFEVVKG